MTETLLPDSWTSVPLADLVVNAQSGFASGDKAVEGGISHLRMNNIGSDGELALDLIRTVPEKLAKQTYALGQGDILVCTTNSSKLVGKTALFNLAGRYVFSNHLTRLRPVADLIDSRFLHWNLWLHWKRGGFEDKCKHWVNQSTLPKEDLLATEIPFPPIAEQRRIAIKVEKVLEKVSRSVGRLERIPTILKRFRHSVLAAACSGRLTADWREANPDVESASVALNRAVEHSKNVSVRRAVPEQVVMPDLVKEWELPDTWTATSTAALLRCGALVDVKDGNHGANHPVVSEFTETGMPFITAAQVNRFRIDYDGAYKISGTPLERIRVGFAKSGDVIYTHKGSVGRVAVADRDCVLTPQTTYYRVSPDILINKYLMLSLASSGFTDQVAVVKEQTTRDFVPISEQYLLFHRIPPIPEQYEIVRRVESLFTLADQLEARYKKGKAYVDKLTQSILAKAFRGELVPQDPNDEPAEKLLERIQAQTPTRSKAGRST